MLPEKHPLAPLFPGGYGLTVTISCVFALEPEFAVAKPGADAVTSVVPVDWASNATPPAATEVGELNAPASMSIVTGLVAA